VVVNGPIEVRKISLKRRNEDELQQKLIKDQKICIFGEKMGIIKIKRIGKKTLFGFGESFGDKRLKVINQ